MYNISEKLDEKAEKEIIGRKMSGISLFVFCVPITV